MRKHDRKRWQPFTSYLKWGFGLLVVCLFLGSIVIGELTFAGPRLDLENRVPLGSGRERTIRQLRFAVATMYSPANIFLQHRKIVEHLAELLEMDGVLIIRSDYENTRLDLQQADVDAALVCPGIYALLYSDPRVEILAMPELLSDVTYRCDIIVSAKSPYYHLTDLEGDRFAYTDRESATGFVLPRAMLRQLGYTPDSFFSQTMLTGSHDLSVRAVTNGYADGAAVSSMVLRSLYRQQPRLESQLRIVASSATFAAPPVLVPASLSPSLKRKLQQALLTMHETPHGQQLLADFGIARFLLPEARAYEPMVKVYRDAGLLVPNVPAQ